MHNKTNTFDVSPITDYLFISSWLKGEYREQIEALGVRLILSMHWLRPNKRLHLPPVRLLWLPTFDNPLTPLPLPVLLRGVEAALPVIHNNGKVLSHCKAGVHRSVIMACCVLIGMGMTADEAMVLAKQQRPVADPYIWYVQARIRKFEKYWQERKPTID